MISIKINIKYQPFDFSNHVMKISVSRCGWGTHKNKLWKWIWSVEVFVSFFKLSYAL